MSQVFDKPVSSIMTPHVVTVLFSDPIIVAVNKMITHDIGAVIVMSAGKPIGIITEKDILTRVILEEKDPRKTFCQNIMSKPLIMVSPDTKIGKALDIMRQNNIRRLPVIEEDELKGIITEKDIIRKLI